MRPLCLKSTMLLVWGIIPGCIDGGMLMRMSDCPAGQGRRANSAECVSADTAKLGAVACIDPDLTSVKSGIEVTLCDGSIGKGSWVPSAANAEHCQADGQIDCLTNEDFPAVKKANILTDKIARGTTILGQVGTKRDMKQCRNAGHLPSWDASGLANIGTTVVSFVANPANVLDATDQLNWHPITYYLTADLPVQLSTSDTMPGGLLAMTTYYVIPFGTTIKLAAIPGGGAIDITSTGVGTLYLRVAPNGVLDIWDTINDYNNGLTVGPTTSPWGADYVCGESNFTDLSASGLSGLVPTNTIPVGATTSFSQVWRDELSGLYFTNTFVNVSWARAMSICVALDSGDGAGKWRLPTQKEAVQLYIDGVSRINVGQFVWTLTTVSDDSLRAWAWHPGTGGLTPDTKDNSSNRGAICVR